VAFFVFAAGLQWGRSDGFNERSNMGLMDDAKQQAMDMLQKLNLTAEEHNYASAAGNQLFRQAIDQYADAIAAGQNIRPVAAAAALAVALIGMEPWEKNMPKP
jgi:hypothetical protein